MGRRCEDTGQPMLVTLPQEGYKNTSEGGMAFFLIVKPREKGKSRQTCIAGDIIFPLQDCQISPRNFPYNFGNDPFRQPLDFDNLWKYSSPIDAGLLIGSTGLSLWSDAKAEYFIPTLKDFTPEGKRLYHTLKKLYGDVTIVTLLDT